MPLNEPNIGTDSGSTSRKARQADATTQLEVDEVILDYLAYKATKAVLREYQSSKDERAQDSRRSLCALHLDLVDSFLVIFRSIHGDHHGTQDLRLRLLLLRFATLFTTRQSMTALKPWTRGLSARRTIQRRNAHTFKSTMIVPDLTKDQSLNSDSPRIKQHQILGERTSDTSQGSRSVSPPVVSLLDTLPLFMALSAAENLFQESRITETWMRLAAGYMTQAVIEQYLVYGPPSSDVLKEAFAWGFDSAAMAKEGSGNWAVNAMFLDEEAEFESWQTIRDEHMRALIPPHGCDLLDHFKLLRENELSLATFEHTILNFLEGLLRSLPRPILVQIQLGNGEETILSKHDFQELKARVGIE